MFKIVSKWYQNESHDNEVMKLACYQKPGTAFKIKREKVCQLFKFSFL